MGRVTPGCFWHLSMCQRGPELLRATARPPARPGGGQGVPGFLGVPGRVNPGTNPWCHSLWGDRGWHHLKCFSQQQEMKFGLC